MIETCPYCGVQVTSDHKMRYQYDMTRKAEEMITVTTHTCPRCCYRWTSERGGYYRVPAEVLDEMIRRLKEQ